MVNYLSFIHTGIEGPKAENHRGALEDGVKLAGNCIQHLEQLDQERFRPRLLILLASSAYIESNRAQYLLEGIHREFVALRHYPDVQLIGSSVAAVFFDGKVHPKGVLLICLASRLLDVKVAYSLGTGSTPENSAKELLQKLDIDRESGEDPNLFANRALLTFLPGSSEQGYLAAKLHNSLRARVWARVPIVGGVSSGYDGRRFHPGVQFLDKQVFKNATVAALLTTRTLLGMSVSAGLERTERKVRITGLCQDNRTVTEFDKRPAREVISELEQEYGFCVLGKRTHNGEPVVERPWAVDASTRVKLLHEARDDDSFRVLKVNPDLLTKGTSDSIENSCKSVGLDNPTGCLGFRCSGFFANHSEVGIDLTEEIARVERQLGIQGGYVGGFFDGEAGRDNLGSSQLRSWSTAAIVFGDELRHRMVVNAGFDQTAWFLSRHPSDAESSESSVFALLKLIYDVGFPGARLFLVLEDNEGRRLVVPDERYTFGSMKTSAPGGFPHCVRLGTNEPSNDPAAQVERASEARFFPYDDSETQATSYYFSPLKTIRQNIIAVIQIDIGKKRQLREDERAFLKRLCTIIGASLTRIFNWQEAIIRHKLQNALRGSLSSSSTVEGVRKYLKGAVKALDLKMGHVRLADPKMYKLKLYAGLGDYYDAAWNARRQIDYGDNSPTTRAFKMKDALIIINDAKNDPEHQRMIARWADTANESELRLRRALEGVGSYANIAFCSERDFSGTINIVSEQPLFFKYPQKRVLHNIAEQIGFLIDHLEQKEAETKALKEAEEASKAVQQINKRLEFIQAVNSHLGWQDLEDFQNTLNDVLDRFRTAVDAVAASLYIHDEARNLYVLRAEVGWNHAGFVDVATYAKDAGWFGIRALQGEPRYIPDLFDYYETEGYRRTTNDDSMPGGHWAPAMFGRRLSEDFSVETIGIPLRSAQEEDIGVLALYRPIEKKQPSGFRKTVVDMIQDPSQRQLVAGVAYDMAGLISALLHHLSNQMEGEEQERRKRISDTLTKHVEGQSSDSFEELICRSVGETYGAVRADLYSINLQRGAHAPIVEPRASYALRGEDGRGVRPPPDDFFNAAVSTYTAKLDKSEIVESDIRIKRKTLVPRDRNDPHLAANEGLVERLCLPLVLGRELLWVLDLRWEISSPQRQGAQDHLGNKYLWLLGDDLSKFSRLHIQTRKRVEAEEEASRHLKSQRGLLGKVSVMAQHAHEWRNQIIDLKGMARDIKGIEDMEARGQAVDELLTYLEVFAGDVDSMLKLTEDESFLAQPFYLRDLIQTQGETRIASKKHNREIACRIDIPEEMRVHVTPRLMKLAFQNIVDNAIKAAKDCPNALLDIRGALDKRTGHVRVSFTNNGKQMAPQFHDAINEERYEDLKTQWGLIIAKSFAQYDGGDLIVRRPDSGETVLIFTLPVASSKEDARWI